MAKTNFFDTKLDTLHDNLVEAKVWTLGDKLKNW